MGISRKFNRSSTHRHRLDVCFFEANEPCSTRFSNAQFRWCRRWVCRDCQKSFNSLLTEPLSSQKNSCRYSEGKRVLKGPVRQQVRSPRTCVAPQGVRSRDVLPLANRTVAHLASHRTTNDSRRPKDDRHALDGSADDPTLLARGSPGGVGTGAAAPRACQWSPGTRGRLSGQYSPNRPRTSSRHSFSRARAPNLDVLSERFLIGGLSERR
jgi:hypothetical protein